METLTAGATADYGSSAPPRKGRVAVPAKAGARRPKGSVLEEMNAERLTECLIKVGQAQDVAAFETLFRHYGPKIRAFMIKRGADRSLAEELMQETMMTIWRKAGQFDPVRGSVSSWIFTVARNAGIDAHRRASRPEFDPDDPAFVPEPAPAADVEYQSRQDAEKVRVAMAKLPPEQKHLLELSFFEEISHRTIADRLGLPLGTVKSRLRLAFGRLRQALGEA